VTSNKLSSDAGAKLLRALGVKGDEEEVRSASDELRRHCLALTLLGSYLTDAYDGDICRRKEVSEHLRSKANSKQSPGGYSLSCNYLQNPRTSILLSSAVLRYA
jgi:hypothetical protein